MAEKNYFEVLNSINVNDKIEKKNGLSYLSWAYAWGELKKKHPDSFYTVYENADGWNYHTDGRTAWVKTGVTVMINDSFGSGKTPVEHIEYLPVMDHRNQSIPLEKITSFDVNKAIQRSLTKAVARHGIGLYIYAGEDLPDEADGKTEPKKDKPLTQEELLFLSQRYTGDNLEKLLDYYKIGDISEIDPKVARNLINQIKAKAKKGGS